ncbi:MAG: hypothetical protein HOP23_09260 [Methylococcaceae bacterium]|nr:hypothetical protein [Methylococcaceae bacterium]
MIQQVNLYQDKLKQGKTNAILNYYSIGLIVTILLLLAVSFYLLANLDKLKAQIIQNRQSLVVEESRVNDLLAKFPKQTPETTLVDQIEQAQNKVSELSQTLQLMAPLKQAAEQGFSRHFQALADQSITDIWLRKIYITGPKRIINLEGSTFKPERLPYFLQNLKQESIFRGQTFAKLMMLKSETTPGLMDFNLNTTTDPQDDHETD